MCGILGISFQNECTMGNTELVKYLLRGLLAESQVRGSDATGVAFVSEENVAVLKNDVGARELLADDAFGTACEEYINLDKTISIIGHTRMKTKGTETDRHNNHPIITDNIVGVHNGIISNDDKLFEKFQKRYDTFKRKGRVDSEIIFRLIDHFVYVRKKKMIDAIHSTMVLLKGSTACALVDRGKPHLLWLFRDFNPIDIYNYIKCGVIIFASDEKFIQNAVGDTGRRELGKPIKIHLPMHYCMVINLKTNSAYKFKLKTSRRISEDWDEVYGTNRYM